MSGLPGPGDPETWGPITSGMDPRYVPCPCEDEGEECEGACEVEPDYEAMMEDEPPMGWEP